MRYEKDVWFKYMGFSEKVANEVLIRCGRHCCLCGKYAGQKMELHHIKQAADGGDKKRIAGLNRFHQIINFGTQPVVKSERH